MSTHVFILVLLTLLIGFIGLVVLIYGFKSNNVSNIKKGTIVVSIAIILFTIMSFMVAKKAVRHYKKQVHSIGVILNEKCCHKFFMNEEFEKKCCGDKEMKCEGKEMKEDAGTVVNTTKIVLDKKTEKLDKKTEKKPVK